MDIKQLHKLTKNIVNPEYDRRCKYGTKAIAEFQTGKAFAVWSTDSVASVNFDGRFIDRKLAELLIANSEPVQADKWHDIALACGGYNNCADDVIDELIAAGIVTPEQVTKALTSFLSK